MGSALCLINKVSSRWSPYQHDCEVFLAAGQEPFFIGFSEVFVTTLKFHPSSDSTTFLRFPPQAAPSRNISNTASYYCFFNSQMLFPVAFCYNFHFISQGWFKCFMML